MFFCSSIYNHLNRFCVVAEVLYPVANKIKKNIPKLTSQINFKTLNL